MQEHKLTGAWRLRSLPLENHPLRRTLINPHADPARVALATLDAPALDDSAWDAVPDSTHLQLHFYPDNPYWGAQLRTLNEKAWVYRRHIPPDAIPTARRYRLRFDGIDYYAEVWLNGVCLGRHEGNFAPFTFDVTAHLRPDRDNLLAVIVTAPWDPPAGGASPVDRVRRGMVKGLYEHAEGVIPPNVNPIGIWQPVHLLADDGVSVEALRITTQIDGTVNVQLALENGGECTRPLTLTLCITAENHDGPGAQATLNVEAAPGRTALTHTLKLDAPRLWWPWDQGAPNLYALEATLGDAGDADHVLCRRREVFGVREVHMERSPERFALHVNGRRVFIRGTGYIPDLYLSRVTPETLTRDLDYIIDAGLNLARVHVHVSPRALYALADRRGLLIWQDFELNWLHDYSAEFEARAVALQRTMFRLLHNHPSVVIWCCYNEPTMLMFDRENLLLRPVPALYADAIQQDTTRPIFMCSGQREDDLVRGGDVHTYYGAIWSKNYTDAFYDKARLNSEFGFEAPAAPDTLRAWPVLWARTKHLEAEIDMLWEYQAALTRYHVEHYRRIRFAPCGGYVHFWLADLAPSVGCGALDALRRPKGGYAALKLASQPIHFFMEHDGRAPVALWAVNDTSVDRDELKAAWMVESASKATLITDTKTINLPAGELRKVCDTKWALDEAAKGCTVTLTLHDAGGAELVRNIYVRPFEPRKRPAGYPWNYDPFLGVKVFDQPGAQSIIGPVNHPMLRPLKPLIHALAEWGLRQELPPRLANRFSQLVELLRGREVLSDE